MSEWYYVSGDEQRGPVTSEELRALAKQGAIASRTLVWKPGLSSWVPAQLVKGMLSEHARVVEPPPLPAAKNGVAPHVATPLRSPSPGHASPPPISAATRTSGVAQAGRRYCRTCGQSIALQAIACTGCGCAPDDGRSYCPACGSQSLEHAIVCVQCGSSLKPVQQTTGKSRVVAGMLAIFLGHFGVHNFYLGHGAKGLLQLLITIIGIFSLAGIPVAAC
ncbi:MAG: GYF domain-containing protein [Phycisphaerales bacterium]